MTLEDEDEFLQHQKNYAYPPETVERVEETARRLLQAVSAIAEPFGSAAERWQVLLTR